MSDFESRLRSKLNRMTAKEETGAVAPYDGVLEKFVEVVNTKQDLPFRMLLERSAVPQRRTITIRPRYGESPRIPLLVMVIQEEELLILAEKRKKISSPKALEAYLERFLDTLGAAVEDFAEMEQQPVQGYLRVRGRFDMERDDVAGQGPPEMPPKLATAKAGIASGREVRPLRFPGAGVYDHKRNYVALESNGFALEAISHEPLSSDKVRITGTVAMSESAAA